MKSRPTRWQEALDNISGALEPLRELQEEYREWLESLPDNLQESATAEKLEAVCDADIDEFDNIIEELASLELPLGFGRD